MRKANAEPAAERTATDPVAKEIIDAQADYMAKARAWRENTDQAYLNSVGN